MMANRRLLTVSQHLAPEPTGMNFHSVNHIARGTTDVPRLHNFYRDVLGFQTIKRPDINIGGSWLRNGNLMVHIVKVDDAEGMQKDAGPKWQTQRAQELEAKVAELLKAEKT